MFECLQRKLMVWGWMYARIGRCKLVRLGDWDVLLYYNYLDEFVDVSIRGANNKRWYTLKVKRTGEWDVDTFPKDSIKEE